MKFKNTILTSLLIGTAFVSTANASLSCEGLGDRVYCENTTQPIQPGNSYSWTVSGVLFTLSGNTYLGRFGCNLAGTGLVTSTVTFTDGTTSTSSQSVSCSSIYNTPGGGGCGSNSGGNQCQQ